MTQTVWVITRKENAYDQFGSYLTAVFTEQPDFHAIKKLMPNATDPMVGTLAREMHVKVDGGSYTLSEVEVGAVPDFNIEHESYSEVAK